MNAAASAEQDQLVDLRPAADEVDRLVSIAIEGLKSRKEVCQTDRHAIAWIATYAAALRSLARYGDELHQTSRLTEVEALLIAIGGGEYLDHIFGGIAISQNEFARIRDFLPEEVFAQALSNPVSRQIIASGNTPENRARLFRLWEERNDMPCLGDPKTDDLVESMRTQMERFVSQEISPHAHKWHLANDYIPASVLTKLGEMGVFGIAIPEEYGGLGLSKVAMCAVTEELSKGFLGVGSLGTRSEIAAELIRSGGTEEQKRKWLPLIASGAAVPTAVFTEPDFGSDLAALRTRAAKVGDHYEITGNKTWITHASRANLMAILVRTNQSEKGHRGLSLLLAEKTAGVEDDLFPDAGLSGTEIEVLGYRGMKEFELAFDRFKVDGQNLLGMVEGEGFKQLMQTFEVARIQTAARSIGVAQAALNLAWRYGGQRRQFGRAIREFDRTVQKLVLMGTEIMMSRQLVYSAARQKDLGLRCDVEAGMAKLLAARIAWASADACVQIHGGNGFALEFEASRLLCDARILSIFEGSAEIQAEVIARGLLQ
jgi:(2S)-methylsuccinyl-CoA dehydrogenase